MITPTTTLIAEGNLQPEDVAKALGLEGVDLLSFNPYDTTDAQTALKVEQASHQVMNTIEVLKISGEAAVYRQLRRLLPQFLPFHKLLRQQRLQTKRLT